MPAVTTVTVAAGTVTMAPPLNLIPIATTPTGGLSGHVFLFDTSAAAGSTVTLSPSAGTAMSAADGSWSIANVAAGVYSVTFAHMGYVSQTVANVVVADNGTVTVPDATLRRDSTIIAGHVIQRLGASPDQSLQLLAIDQSIEVVSETNAAAVPVGAGTAANQGAIGPDDEHLWLSDSHGLLWVGTTDGRSLSLLSGTFNGFAFFSPNGSHLVFQAKDAQGNSCLYLASTSGGAPTLVATSPTMLRAAPWCRAPSTPWPPTRTAPPTPTATQSRPDTTST